MDERVMAREKFEKDFDNAVFRSTSKEVFVSFLVCYTNVI